MASVRAAGGAKEDAGLLRVDMEQAAANAMFGTAVWVAFVIHAALVEWYLAATREGTARSKPVPSPDQQQDDRVRKGSSRSKMKRF